MFDLPQLEYIFQNGVGGMVRETMKNSVYLKEQT